MLTTTEAAALLSEHGHGGYKGKPLTADAVKRQCYRGVYPNAKHGEVAPRGAAWCFLLRVLKIEHQIRVSHLWENTPRNLLTIPVYGSIIQT